MQITSAALDPFPVHAQSSILKTSSRLTSAAGFLEGAHDESQPVDGNHREICGWEPAAGARRIEAL